MRARPKDVQIRGEDLMFREITAGRLLEEQAEKMGGSRFLTFAEDGRTWTYGQFNTEVNRLAHGLVAIGVRPGDRVGIMSPNRPEYLFSSFAIRKLGAIEVGINGELRGSDLDKMLRRAQPRLVILDPTYNANFATVALQATLDGIISLGPPPPAFSGTVYAYETIRTDDTENPDTYSDDMDLALMVLSGGTTGVSKGIIGSHRYVNSFSHGLINTYDISTTDRVYAPWPLHHIVGPACDTNTALLAGAGGRSGSPVLNVAFDGRSHQVRDHLDDGAWNFPKDHVEHPQKPPGPSPQDAFYVGSTASRAQHEI